MKKSSLVFLVTFVIVMMCVACGGRTCHYCGKEISSDPLKKDGRYYCDYDCYMSEVMGF